MVTREDEQQRPNAEGDAIDSPLERLKGSMRKYGRPFEPVGIEDWEALDLEDDTTTPRGGT